MYKWGEMWNGGKQDFGNKLIVLNAISGLIFQYKNAKKMSLKKYYTIKLFQLLQKGKSAKEIADMFSLKIRSLYIISYPAVKMKDD